MVSTNPATLAKYRENTKAARVYVTVRKRCPCGAQVTSKQMLIYAMCAKCVAQKKGESK